MEDKILGKKCCEQQRELVPSQLITNGHATYIVAGELANSLLDTKFKYFVFDNLSKTHLHKRCDRG